MRLCLAEKSHSELREWEMPAPDAVFEKVCTLSGVLGRLPVPPMPSTKVSLNEPLPPSAPPVADPFMYQITDPTPWPPRRNDTSVPGITIERGKLPAITGPPGPGPTEGPACASWSTRRWRSSWLARRSASSSARVVVDRPVANTKTGRDHPITGIKPAFRFPDIRTPDGS